MERNIIRIDEFGNVTLPNDITNVWMNEAELLDLFGVTAPTIRARIKALCKSGVLREYEIKRTIRISDKCNMKFYNLETIIALAFHFGTFGAKLVRNAILKRLYLRKEKQAIFFSILRKVIIVVPLTYIMPLYLHMGTDGVFLAEPVSNVIGGTLCFVTMLVTIMPELKRMENKNVIE